MASSVEQIFFWFLFHLYRSLLLSFWFRIFSNAHLTVCNNVHKIIGLWEYVLWGILFLIFFFLVSFVRSPAELCGCLCYSVLLYILHLIFIQTMRSSYSSFDLSRVSLSMPNTILSSIFALYWALLLVNSWYNISSIKYSHVFFSPLASHVSNRIENAANGFVFHFPLFFQFSNLVLDCLCLLFIGDVVVSGGASVAVATTSTYRNKIVIHL